MRYPNWLEAMVISEMSAEDIELITNRHKLEIEWAEDGIYPTPDDDEEFFSKYVRIP